MVLTVAAVVVAGVLGYAFRGKEAKALKAVAAELAKLEASGVADAKTVIAAIKAKL